MSARKTTDRDRGAKRIQKEIAKAEGAHVDVGVFGGVNPEGESVLAYAIYTEFGAETPTGNVPAFAYMRSTVDSNRQVYQDKIQKGFVKVTLGKEKVATVLKELGIQIKNDIVKTITTLRTPANQPSTKARKNGKKELIDSGTLRRAITERVFENRR